MATEPIIDIDLGPHNGTLKFFSIDEVREFEKAQREAWSWLDSPPVKGSIQGPWNTISGGLNQVRSFIGRVGDGSDPNVVQPLANALEQAFRSSRVPLSDSPVGKFIGELRSDAPVVAAAALATWMNVGGVNLSNFDHAKGVVLMAAFDANITNRTPSAVKRSLETLQQKYQEISAKTEQETREQRTEFSREKSRQRKAVASLLRQSRRRLMAFRQDKSRQVDEITSNLGQEALAAISSIRETEALYREHMKIKGPVEYWSSKASAHREKAGNYRNVLLGFSVIAGAILLICLYLIADHAIKVATTDKPAAVYLVLVTLGVVLTTIVFWAARILTRLFLSEHHLAIDAEERSVMAQTYLALTAEGQATEQERSIVLGSLFRPTADGIVKDDAAPDLSPASMLSKITAR